MNDGKPKTFFYKRPHFVTHLPLDYLYAPSHSWIARHNDDSWRVGLTKFATRMLGEIVDHGFDTPPDSPVSPGQVVGWIEGFKAISDIFCIGSGAFEAVNPALKTRINLVAKDPYGEGWFYSFRGTPDPRCMNLDAYRVLLDQTIDRILEKQKTSD